MFCIVFSMSWIVFRACKLASLYDEDWLSVFIDGQHSLIVNSFLEFSGMWLRVPQLIHPHNSPPSWQHHSRLPLPILTPSSNKVYPGILNNISIAPKRGVDSIHFYAKENEVVHHLDFRSTTLFIISHQSHFTAFPQAHQAEWCKLVALCGAPGAKLGLKHLGNSWGFQLPQHWVHLEWFHCFTVEFEDFLILIKTWHRR